MPYADSVLRRQVDELEAEVATLKAERNKLREQLQKVTEERNELQAALRNRAG
jgi:uncharacterized protein YlxW (UPF0749 family)